MLKKILIVVAVAVAALCAVIATRPNTFHIERSSVIAAAPEAVFAEVNDFQRWPAWSPWEKLDPNMKRDITGEPGVGQKYHWAGNSKAGEGEMRIAESTPSSLVRIDLDFIKPFPSSCKTTFTLAPEGAGTKVSWAMDGPMDFMSKAMCLFQSMDAMIGPDFERGLAGLGNVTAAASGATPDSAATGAPAGGTTR